MAIGIGRGYPDVSANGLNAAVYVHGKLEPVGGTSMAAPLFASMLTRVSQNPSQVHWYLEADTVFR
jgi:subtilase family serine protease